MKKKTAPFICMLIIVLLSFLLTSCLFTNTDRADNSSTKILALGDSIAGGIIGTYPASERNNYSYLELVGQINKFSYKNLAIGGSKTEQLRDYVLQNQSNEQNNPIKPIMEADIIIISILGNDFLNKELPEHFKDSLETPPIFTKYDAILSASYSNIDKIVKRIRKLNSDVTLIFQTLYNPVYPNSSNIMKPDYRQYIRENYQPEATEEDFYDMTAVMIDRLNNVLYRYLESNPNAFEILDVNKKFDTLHKSNPNKLERLIFNDEVGHPSSEGLAVIACLLQEWLEEHNLAEHTSAFNNYKNVRKNQLNRLYTGTSVDINSASALIDSALTYDEINDAYFDAINNISPNTD
ncbi:MAG TPA: GDSL-type esterase/lipase family protein [Clostridia bacterium]|jgi:lysophospholipase L1-like esterase|nr:GDSL-type esterase/lipase family protein [Clostridia bacterium]